MWRVVGGKAVQRHPSAYAYANGADFGLTSIWSIGPDTDASLGSPCSYAEFTESGNDPILQIMNEVPDILAAFPQIDLDIARALTRSGIGVASATCCLVARKSRFTKRTEEHTSVLQSLMRI